MRHLGLFEGIGGFMLAAEWMGWEHVAWVEWDKKCQLVLKKNFPKVKGYGDIKEFNGSEYWGKVDIITGGFPCQPFSNAGKRKGKDDDRYLWPEMLRVIREIKPTFVVGENVAGLVTMENGKTLDDILTDLEDEGYTIESFIIPACAVQAWHRRDRIWILAYSINSANTSIERQKRKEEGLQRIGWKEGQSRKFDRTDSSFFTNSYKKRLEGNIKQGKNKEWKNTKRHIGSSSRTRTGWQVEPSVGRVVNGVSGRVDRIKQLGNAIVPQVAYELFKAIERI